MRMVTIDAAYTLGVDDRLGSIEAGKYADFVVLDKDPQEVSAKTIKDIKVIATITAGRAMLTSQTRKPDWQLPPSAQVRHVPCRSGRATTLTRWVDCLEPDRGGSRQHSAREEFLCPGRYKLVTSSSSSQLFSSWPFSP